MCLALQNGHCAFFLAKFIFFENHHNSYAICYKLVLIPKYAKKSKMTPLGGLLVPFLMLLMRYFSWSKVQARFSLQSIQGKRAFLVRRQSHP